MIESTEFILQNNHFMFHYTLYRQKPVITMGTMAAPVIAGIKMGYLELTIYGNPNHKI